MVPEAMRSEVAAVEIEGDQHGRIGRAAGHVHGGGIWETRNASSSTPSWNEAIGRPNCRRSLA